MHRIVVHAIALSRDPGLHETISCHEYHTILYDHVMNTILYHMMLYHITLQNA